MTDGATALPGDVNKILDKSHQHEEHAGDAKAAHPAAHGALPHSREDATEHQALHGTEERKEHKASDVVYV